ncbi:cyanophycinase [Agromyces sp. NPDC058110]|uniref:cyanophycinase n=1 Tax=Agromyces sp. NPDC058110 TaxID=3346345 RepID=UPI0036DDE7D0
MKHFSNHRLRSGTAVATAVGIAAALLVTAAPAVASPKPSPVRPHAVLIGGALSENPEILRSIVDLADPDGSGPAKARIAIVSAAASPAKNSTDAADDSLNNAAANGLYYSALFQRFGAETYAVPIDAAVNYDGDPYTPARANDPAVVAELSAATGVFFGGGDQMRYVRTLLDCAPATDEAFSSCTDTPVMSALRAAADRGVVAGVSAGLTIQQGPDMVTGGEPYEAWRDGGQPGYLDDPNALAYLPYGGLGFVQGALLDSHFTTWGRQARAIKLGLETDHPLVLGVDETTAVVVDRRTGQGRVIGEHGASLLDLRLARETASGVKGVRWSYLTSGDRLNLRLGLPLPAAGSNAIKTTGAAVAPRADVWDSLAGDGGTYSLRDLAVAAIGSSARTTTGTTLETGPQFRTTLVRDVLARGWITPAGGSSFAGLEVRIDRIP